MNKSQLQQKQNILLNASKVLKNEFVGLDNIIDNVINSITTWFLYPDFQVRPQIINLWGMTGTGKTSLVKRLSELLQYQDNFYLFDMGSNSEHIDNIKTHFKKMFEVNNGRPAMIVFDEFQYANTKDELGKNIDKIYSRAVWDILDTGKFQVACPIGDIDELIKARKELEFLLSKGVIIKNGYVTKEISYYLNVTQKASSRNRFSITEEDFDDLSEGAKTTKEKLFFAYGDVMKLYKAFQDEITPVEIRDKLLQLNGEETLALYNRAISKAQSRKEIDCTKCLIFILGNLDAAYSFGNDINPDADADMFYELSKNISVSKIKQTLQTLLKNEQIARLGNNHIIYPAFSKKVYHAFIASKLEAISKMFEQQTSIKIVFTASVHQLIYAEGVYPSQGTRPVVSTIQQHIEIFISKWVAIAQHTQGCAKIIIKSNKNKLITNAFDVTNNCVYSSSDKLLLQLIPLRKVFNDNQQSVVAIHESGHALAHIVLNGSLPNNIFTITANTDCEGFVEVKNEPRSVETHKKIKHNIAISLAGMAAEEVIFGQENKSFGSVSDIKQATKWAAILVKKSGIYENPYYIDSKENRNELTVCDSEMYNEKVKRVIDECFETAKQVIQKHKSLLLTMGIRLTTCNHLNKKQLGNIITVYNAVTNNPIKIVEPFNYKQALLHQHQEITIHFTKKQNSHEQQSY